jgi:hypothetical protein
MDKNQREEWIHDLATEHVNRTSKAGQFAFAVCHVQSWFEGLSDEELKEKFEKKPKKKSRGGGF